METMSNAAITVQQLSFTYSGRSFPCFSNLHLTIQAGERFGLFGPNGAGKTTLMSCITGILPFKEGKILVENVDVSVNKKKANTYLGFVPQDFAFYQELSPMQNFAFFGAMHGLSTSNINNKTTELLEVFGLTEVRNTQIKKFSGGMKRKVNLAIGVINNPKILILDEPTVGVDIQTRLTIIDYLKKLNDNGATLVYTSHQLNEAEKLCDKIALIDNGKIIVHDTLPNLFKQYNENNLESLYLKLTGKNYC
jgi:ABC-2 type transport system ATP-binding protein